MNSSRGIPTALLPARQEEKVDESDTVDTIGSTYAGIGSRRSVGWRVAITAGVA